MSVKDRILAIETAVSICSVCVAHGSEILALREDFGVNNHSEKLNKFIQEVMNESATSFDSLAAVAVSGGPGSFTGLRIGVSSAKGICYAAEIPLIAVDTLQAMAYMMLQDEGIKHENVILQPMIDARRMEVYTSVFDLKLNQMIPVRADIVNENYFDHLQSDQTVVIAGNGAEKFRMLFADNQQVVFVDGNVHTALGVASLAMKKYESGEFADLAYFEPFYLKDFIPGKSKVKGLE
jgi:tRNA threonylcarbamoyladenosine biosynthesis protein TsaB